jgi:hypothetical protein
MTTSSLTLALHPDQIKAIIRQAAIADLAMVKEIVEAVEKSTTSDEQFDQAVEDIFNRYDDVFKALA